MTTSRELQAFSDWYDALPDGDPSYQETFEAGAAWQAAQQPAEPEWIDDPHDIEQGLMRNPKWKPAADQRAVMQAVLKCLEIGSEKKRDEAIAALRQALAAPQVQVKAVSLLPLKTVDGVMTYDTGADSIKAAPAAKVPDMSQDWAGMDGTTAHHLIERQADNWADVGKMMGEWLAANQAPARLPLDDETRKDAARWRAWAPAMCKGCDDIEDEPLIRELAKLTQKHEGSFNVEQFNAWIDAAIASIHPAA